MSQQCTKIFVGSLPPNTPPEELRRLFENYGVVVECDVMNRCGFVHMETSAMAETAIEALNATEFKGQMIVVEPGRPKEQRKSGGGAGGSGSPARAGNIGRGGRGGGGAVGGRGGGRGNGRAGGGAGGGMPVGFPDASSLPNSVKRAAALQLAGAIMQLVNTNQNPIQGVGGPTSNMGNNTGPQTNFNSRRDGGATVAKERGGNSNNHVGPVRNEAAFKQQRNVPYSQRGGGVPGRNETNRYSGGNNMPDNVAGAPRFGGGGYNTNKNNNSTGGGGGGGFNNGAQSKFNNNWNGPNSGGNGNAVMASGSSNRNFQDDNRNSYFGNGFAGNKTKPMSGSGGGADCGCSAMGQIGQDRRGFALPSNNSGQQFGGGGNGGAFGTSSGGGFGTSSGGSFGTSGGGSFGQSGGSGFGQSGGSGFGQSGGSGFGQSGGGGFGQSGGSGFGQSGGGGFGQSGGGRMNDAALFARRNNGPNMSGGNFEFRGGMPQQNSRGGGGSGGSGSFNLGDGGGMGSVFQPTSNNSTYQKEFPPLGNNGGRDMGRGGGSVAAAPARFPGGQGGGGHGGGGHGGGGHGGGGHGGGGRGGGRGGMQRNAPRQNNMMTNRRY